MKNKLLLLTLLVTNFFPHWTQAQDGIQMADTMRDNGKIFVVAGVLLIIFSGLFTYLFIVDFRLKKLEQKIK